MTISEGNNRSYTASHFNDTSLSGAVEDLQLLFQVGYRVAQGEKWPEMETGTEFKAKREAPDSTPLFARG